MTDQQGDQRILAEALDRFIKKSDQLLNTGNRNTAKIEVNAGGIGVWIAVSACVVMLSVALIGSVFVTYQFDQQNEQLRELREKDDIHDAWLQTLNNNKQDKQK